MTATTIRPNLSLDDVNALRRAAMDRLQNLREADMDDEELAALIIRLSAMAERAGGFRYQQRFEP